MAIVETEDLDELFNEAVGCIHAYKGPAFSTKSLLELYSLYKVSTAGQCMLPKPGLFEFHERAKWSAWNDLADLPQPQAKLFYIELVSKLIGYQIELGTNSDDGNLAHNTAALSTGFHVSSMSDSREWISDADKTIFDWAEEGNVTAVESLLDTETSINIRDSEGMTLLHWAVDRDHLKLAQVLIQRGIQVDAQDSSGQTSLHYALMIESKQMVELLLSMGHASIKIADNDGATPLDLAPDEFCSLLKHGSHK
ncbi:hypothetical protein BDV3_004330 [Batrachochytrium dendrobatidis]|uniref:ACB domain-containing protein n=1 Tax=Batrachochytrium dendrobatidis (strain JEL423) TaxID=403673 RepID=A0A177WHB3_BATDL|nr:hypothetical protein BDEG_22787 [Batrachochytrium dendrobatidis JEL423]